MSLPTNPKERKHVPIATGCIDYFSDAIVAVAVLSRVGNEQHNPGKPLHWDRSKSGDESDALMRHFIERGTIDTDGVRHSTKVAWRALALLQKEIESENPFEGPQFCDGPEFDGYESRTQEIKDERSDDTGSTTAEEHPADNVRGDVHVDGGGAGVNPQRTVATRRCDCWFGGGNAGNKYARCGDSN